MTRSLRIITGLILFAYVTGHLINLSLGLHSVELMEAWRGPIQAIWTNYVGLAVLSLSMITHALLGLSSLYHRNTLKMAPGDAIQFLSGFLIVPLLIPHIVGIQLGLNIIPDYVPTYRGVLHFFWIQNPLEGLRQISVLSLVWIHGAIGVLTFFRLQKWWPRYGGFINPLIVLVPLAAMLGFAEAGKQVIDTSPEYVASIPSPEFLEILNILTETKWTIILIYLLMFLLTLVARHLRLSKNNHLAHIQYAGSPPVSTATGASLLEIAIANDIPHAKLCRGRGRCGTCRVRILASAGELPQPSELEQTTLTKVGAGPDERLACQLKPVEGTISVERLIPPYIEPKDLLSTYGMAKKPEKPHRAETQIASVETEAGA